MTNRTRRHGRTRFALPAAILLTALAWLITGCGSGGNGPVMPDVAGCPATISALIRSAPASADDRVTGTWLGRVDKLRDLARAFKDPVDQQVAAELDYAGAEVAMSGTPPQIAIVPARETCTVNHPASQSVSAAAVLAARAWLAGLAPPARPGLTAGVVTRVTTGWVGCPVSARGSQVTRGGGCETWLVTLTTATGTLRATCGNLAAAAACTSATARPVPAQFVPDIGDVLYVPENGEVTATADISIISQIPWAAFPRWPWPARHLSLAG